MSKISVWMLFSVCIAVVLAMCPEVAQAQFAGGLEGKVNGVTKQNANLNQMIWSVAEQISKLSEANELKRVLGDGFMAATFDVVAKYSPKKGDPVITDKLIGCRIKASDKSFSQGNEPLAVKFDLFVMLLVEDGVKPLPVTLGV